MTIKTPYLLALGLYRRKRKHNKAAVKIYRELVKTSPNSKKWRYDFAKLLMKRKQFQLAIDQIDILLKKSPDDLEYQMTKARCLTSLDRYDEAQQIYQKLLLQHPDDCHVNYYVANSYFRHKDYEDAIRYYKRSINLAQNEQNSDIISFANHRLGYIYQVIYNPQESSDHYQKAIDASTLPKSKQFGVGYLHFRLGWNEEALAEYRKQLDQDPKNAELWFETARAYSKMSLQSEAAKCYKKFIKHDQEFQSDPYLDDKLVVFDTFLGRNYADSPRAIYEYMLTSDEYRDYKFVWAFRKFKPRLHWKLYLNRRTKIVKYRSREYFIYFGHAKYWVVNSRYPFVLKTHDQQVYIQTWHGTPLKRLGCDIVDQVDGKYDRTVIDEQYVEEARKLDYLVSPSAYASDKFISAFALDKLGKRDAIIEQGYPRNDRLVNASQKEITRLRRKFKIPTDKKVLLYAPTWRDNQHVEGQGYVYKTQADFDYLKKQLGDDWVILFRAHYFIANGFNFSAYKGFVYDVSDVDDINELYLVSDVLMTDYSSVFFDYANLQRPMIFFMYDLELYRDDIRGFYIDIDELPGDIVKTEAEIVSIMKNLDPYIDKHRNKYVEFHNKFNYLDDGKATKRTVEHVLKT